MYAQHLHAYVNTYIHICYQVKNILAYADLMFQHLLLVICSWGRFEATVQYERQCIARVELQLQVLPMGRRSSEPNLGALCWHELARISTCLNDIIHV